MRLPFMISLFMMCWSFGWVPTTYSFYKKRRFDLQQGLKKGGFGFQKKTVQLKTALLEVYTYVLKWIFFQKTV